MRIIFYKLYRLKLWTKSIQFRILSPSGKVGSGLSDQFSGSEPVSFIFYVYIYTVDSRHGTVGNRSLPYINPNIHPYSSILK